jgi:hypothetical protein
MSLRVVPGIDGGFVVLGQRTPRKTRYRRGTLEPGLHRGRDAEGLMHATEVEPHHEDRDRRLVMSEALRVPRTAPHEAA